MGRFLPGGKSVAKISVGSAAVSKVVYKGETVWPEASAYSPICFSSESVFTVSLGTSKTWDGTVYYSSNGSVWSEYTAGNQVEATQTNGVYQVYFRGENTYISSYDDDIGDVNYSAFKFNAADDADISCNGNIMSLLNKDVITENGCFYNLFSNCSSLTTAPALPATTLAENCYTYMFIGCTSLTTAPALPATTLDIGCYAFMFGGCTALAAAPALPATTLAEYCYNGMFEGCAALAAAPALPATTLTEGCYSEMFKDCIALAAAPALPATTLTEGCYNAMFEGCAALAAAPALPATTLAEYCYNIMFKGCAALAAAPALPATTLTDGCYSEMFKDCSDLYVSNNQGTVAPVVWTIPTAGTFANEITQLRMFDGCAGTRATNNLVPTAGSAVTYYTQNTPVS